MSAYEKLQNSHVFAINFSTRKLFILYRNVEKKIASNLFHLFYYTTLLFTTTTNNKKLQIFSLPFFLSHLKPRFHNQIFCSFRFVAITLVYYQTMYMFSLLCSLIFSKVLFSKPFKSFQVYMILIV